MIMLTFMGVCATVTHTTYPDGTVCRRLLMFVLCREMIAPNFAPRSRQPGSQGTVPQQVYYHYQYLCSVFLYLIYHIVLVPDDAHAQVSPNLKAALFSSMMLKI